jgi:DNA-binding transcriptional LysR family regulator
VVAAAIALSPGVMTRALCRSANLKVVKLNVTLRQLRAFLLVHNLGSFGKAAEALSMTQGALSHLIRELERQVGFRVFDRTTRSLALTVEGKTYLRQAEQVLMEVQKLNETADDVLSRKNRQFRLGSTAALVASRLPPMLHEFSLEHPDVRIDLKDMHPDELVNAMAEGDIDLAIGPIRRRTPASVSRKILFGSPIALVVSRDHAFAKMESVSWEQLKGQTFVFHSNDSKAQLQADSGVDLSGNDVIELSHLHSILSVVESGGGITVVAEYAIKYLRIHDVVAVPLRSPQVMLKVGLYRNKHHALSEAAEHFYEFVASRRH